jgi:pimeloyl-ACP methyl ester carboxylesterase
MTKPLAIPGPLGLKLAALYDEPTISGPYPLVILLHGNTGWMEENHLASLAQDLARAGIAALRFDAPGSGQSGGTWAGEYRVTNYIEAVDCIYDFAARELNIDTTRVGLWAHSMGGIVAIYAAAKHPDRFRCLCLCQASPGPMAVDEESTVGEWQRTGWKTIPTEIFGDIRLPFSYYLDRSQYKTPLEVKKLNLPLLVIAGSKDVIVPVSSVRTIYEAANQPKQYLEFKAGHDYKYDPPRLAEINQSTVKFFVQNLSP